MPTFKYTAKKGPSNTVAGVLEAPTRNDALAQLATLGYTPVRVEEDASGGMRAPVAAPRVVLRGRTRRRRVPPRAVNTFTRQFASLVRSQIPMLRALGIMTDQTAHPALRAILVQVTEDIRQGKTLSEALERHPEAFSPLYVSLTRSGEIGGMLDTILDRLAAQADRDEQLRSQLRSAMAYPLFVGVVGLGTVVYLLTFVMPRLLRLLAGYQELPWATRVLMAVTRLMSQWWFWAAVAAGGVLFGLLWATRRAALLAWCDRWNLRLPILGPVLRQLELARFARAFALLLEHGVSVLQATDVAIPVVRHTVIRRELLRLPAGLKQGNSLATCLKSLSVVTPFVVNTVAVGEETGRAGEAFAEAATYYERELEGSLRLLATLLEPAMVLLVGVMVGWIVMAVLLPIFELSAVAR